MALNPSQIQQLSLFMVEIYNSIEQDILVNIGKYLSTKQGLMDEDIHAWQMMKLSQLGELTKEQVKAIASYAGKTEEELTKLLQQVGYASAADSDKQLLSLFEGAAPAMVPPVQQSSAIISVLNAFERQAKETFNLINTTLLDQSRKIYLDILSQTVAKVLTGLQTPRQALRTVASEWAQKGVPALIDKSGRAWSTEAYVSMTTRTMSQKVANEMQFTRMEEYDVDLIEVSSHIGARPRCAPFQGRIFSKSGNSKRYPAWSTTSYGEPAGLLGINCHHVIYPYVQGKSSKTYQPYNKEENDKAYEQSQQQRKYERDIRKAKKELAMMQAMKDEQGIADAKAKVSNAQKNMREFIAESGRTRRRDREQIVGG